MAVFWNTLDSHLVNMFDTAMGADSAYSTLKVQTVNSNVFATAYDYATWTLPAIASAGWRIEYQPEGHMGAAARIYRKTYKCLAFGIVAGTTTALDTLESNIKELYERMEDAIRTNRFALGDSEKGRGAIIRTGEIDIVTYPQDDLDSVRRMGIAYFAFDVESTNT